MKLKTLFALFLGAAVLGGCQKDLDELDIPREELIPIQLGGQIDQVATSRVNDEGFCDGDGVGIYVVNYVDGVSGTLLDEGNQADNVRFVFDEANLAWTPDYPIYYYDKVTPVDIIGYYPYSNINKVNTYPFEVAKDQSTEAANGLMGGYEASDFLWGKAANITPTSSRVTISYQHRMAGVQVELVEGEGFAEGEWAQLDKQILVSNTIRKASIDLATGVVTPTGETPTTGIVPAKSGEQWRAVVVPQTVSAQMALLNITVDGIPYIFRKSEAFEYVAGKLHKFIIEVKKKEQSGLEFKLVGEAITAWESETITHDGTAREYIIIDVPEANTKESALALAIAEAGYDYTQIKNLKVTGYINNLDFVFMKAKMTKLQSLNLKEATISANGTSYPANEIPESAFTSKKTLVRFVFPENITKIGTNAFYGSNLTGSLIIPNSVNEIGTAAFDDCSALSGTLTLSNSLVKIGNSAFARCSNLNGSLEIPESVREIGVSAFYTCNGFVGSLNLPEELRTIGKQAFYGCNKLTGSLTIPEKITTIPEQCFYACGFDETLTLSSNLTSIEKEAFGRCQFRGNLILPQSVLTIGDYAFMSNQFNGNLIFPKELAHIGSNAFNGCKRLSGILEIPKEIVFVSSYAFAGCSSLQGVILPRTMENIGASAFQNCYQLNAITCKATTPPTVASTAFNGVAKDNFTVEVPEAAVAEYTTAPVWKEFKRFAAHRDFSISRNLFRTLNDSESKTLVLRADADAAWTVEAPEWITVTPSSGVGKTEVTVTVSEMTASDVGTFEVTSYTSNGSTTTTTYNGRAGKVVFHLTGKDYSSTTTVEQYNYTYGDGDYIVNQPASEGNGVNIVFMGDCFDAQDIATGKYLNGVNEAIEHFFAVEPYKSYKKYFNIYTVFGLSADSGVGSVNTIREAKFGSQYGLQASGSVGVDENSCFEYACKAPTVTEDNICQTPIVLVENTYEYDGITYMWGDGSAIALCPMSQDAYPYDYRGIVQHEAGGHAFGKLGDEYIYHNAFIQTCSCTCCDHVDEFNRMKSYGFYENLSLTGNMHDVPWSHMIFDPQYSGTVDIYEGGFFHTRGVFRSESNSCMNNNVPYFSAISREAIVKRIMEYAGETYSFEAFKANDVPLAVEDTATAATRSSHHIPYAPQHQQAPVLMGDKPVLNF